MLDSFVSSHEFIIFFFIVYLTLSVYPNHKVKYMIKLIIRQKNALFTYVKLTD
jgi:hypothetical protein